MALLLGLGVLESYRGDAQLFVLGNIPMYTSVMTCVFFAYFLTGYRWYIRKVLLGSSLLKNTEGQCHQPLKPYCVIQAGAHSRYSADSC